MKTQALLAILLTIFTLSFGSNSALAIDVPNFPTCSNPQGTIKVSYSDGTHGIVGDGAQYTGSDTVYQLDNGNLMQCFCSTNGQGIQTNWWKDGSITTEQRQILINSGWINIPNGALWGLEETSYFAKNADFSCGSGNNDSSGNGGRDGGDGRSDGLGCASHDCSNQGQGGQVLGISTSIGEVLGLASTGGNYLPFILATIGLSSLGAGLLLNRKTSKK